MAQTGFTPISLYYTATAAATPTAGNLVAGELAINTNDGKLFYKDSSGVVQTIASKAAAALATNTTGTGANVLATSPTITNPALGGSTSGSVTLAVPAVAGSNTATLPAATGTVMVSGNMPAFSAYSSSTTTIADSTFTKITYGTEDFDTNNNFASSTFTPTVAGYYQINANFRFGTAFAATQQAILIYKNGSVWNRGGGGGTALLFGYLTASTLVYCNGSTDYIEVYAYQNSGSSVTNDNSSWAKFSGCLVRTA